MARLKDSFKTVFYGTLGCGAAAVCAVFMALCYACVIIGAGIVYLISIIYSLRRKE